MNAPYLKRLRTGRPWVHGKWAMTLDGKIATRTGESKWITGEPARAEITVSNGSQDSTAGAEVPANVWTRHRIREATVRRSC